MNVERRSIFCIRYMPTLRTPVAWSLVITAGSVMNGAGSSGQQRWIGSRSRSTSSPVSTTSWQAPFETSFGIESAIDLSLPSERTLSTRPCGGCSSRISSSRAPRSSRLSTPNAMHIRRSVPNWLTRSGCRAPFGFSKSTAGPPPFTRRSTISVASRSGSTSAETRTSSPSRSRSAIHSRRSETGLGIRGQSRETGPPPGSTRVVSTADARGSAPGSPPGKPRGKAGRCPRTPYPDRGTAVRCERTTRGAWTPTPLWASPVRSPGCSG